MGSDSRERHALAGELLADADHECNNQLAYLLSNLQNMVEYADDLARVIGLYRARVAAAGLVDDELRQLEAQIDLDFVLGDLGRAAREGLVGASRLRDILRIIARVGDDEPSDGGIVDVGRIVRQAAGLSAKAIGMRARLELEADLPGNATAEPAVLTRAVVVMLKHAITTFEPRARAHNVLRVSLARQDDRLAIRVERIGARADERAGLELAVDAAARLGAELHVEPLATTLLLVEAV